MLRACARLPGTALFLSVLFQLFIIYLTHAAPAAEVTTESRGPRSHSFPRGCSGLQLEGPLGVCSSYSDVERKNSNSWGPLSPLLLDGCSAFVLLLLLLLLIDTAELLLPTLWSNVFCLLASLRGGARNSDTSGVRTPELHALEQQEQQLQRELKQYNPTSDFVAYARLQRQLAKVAAAKETCMRQQQQQQQQNSSSSSSEGGLWTSLLWPIMRPVLLANSWVMMKCQFRGVVAVLRCTYTAAKQQQQQQQRPFICWIFFRGILGATVKLPTSQLAPLGSA
ncbi:hypothetical protein Emed_001335 [Eimeria media]